MARLLAALAWPGAGAAWSAGLRQDAPCACIRRALWRGHPEGRGAADEDLLYLLDHHRALVVEGADKLVPDPEVEQALFHAWNLVKDAQRHILLTGVEPPLGGRSPCLIFDRACRRLRRPPLPRQTIF